MDKEHPYDSQGFEFSKDGYEEIFESIYELMQAVQEQIRQNYDPRKKEIGDRVVPWDDSSLSSMDGNLILLSIEPFVTSDYFIVVENDLDHYITHEFEFGSVFEFEEDTDEIEYDGELDEDYDLTYRQDLIIAHPGTKELFRISSEHVKILNYEQ